MPEQLSTQLVKQDVILHTVNTIIIINKTRQLCHKGRHYSCISQWKLDKAVVTATAQ